MAHSREIVLLASAARTSSAAGDEIVVLPGFRELILFMDITASAGTSPTLDVYLQSGIRANGGEASGQIADGTVTWNDYASFVQQTTTAARVWPLDIYASPQHWTTGIGDGVTTVTTAGTDVALAGSTRSVHVSIQAQTDNTGKIAVGASGVDATIATGDGVLLDPGDIYTFDIDNLADVFIDSTVSGDGVRYTYFTESTQEHAKADASLIAGSRRYGPIGDRLRVKYVVGGTSPSFTFSVVGKFVYY